MPWLTSSAISSQFTASSGGNFLQDINHSVFSRLPHLPQKRKEPGVLGRWCWEWKEGVRPDVTGTRVQISPLPRLS